MKIDRLISIIMTLSTKERVTAKELAYKYEVSEKTIRRDMETIELAGIPLVTYQGSNGGYGIIENFKINSGTMNEGEVYLIKKLLEGIGSCYDSKEVKSLNEKFSIISQKEREVEKDIIIDFSAWGDGKKTKEKIKMIERAMNNNCELLFNYTNLKGEIRKRRIEPLKLIFKGQNWYIHGFCLEKNDERLFKVRRIHELHIGEKIKEKREANTCFSFNNREENLITLKLECKKEFLNRVDDYFDDYNIEEDKDSIFIISELPEDNWLYSMLIGIGDVVQVLEPTDVRQKIKEKIDRMHRLYE